MKINVPSVLNDKPSKTYWERCYPDVFTAKLAFRIALKVYHRTMLSEAQNHRCCYCGCKMTEQANHKNSATIDHVLPKSKGGANHPDNYVIACYSCNTKRGSTPAEQFLLEKSAESSKSILRKQMHEMGLHFGNNTKASRLRRKLDAVEIKKIIEQGLPNPYESGTRQFKMYERYITAKAA